MRIGATIRLLHKDAMSMPIYCTNLVVLTERIIGLTPDSITL